MQHDERVLAKWREGGVWSETDPDWNPWG